MQWISEKTCYCGYSNLGPSNCIDIINFSFEKGFEGAINCANKAILLSDCLLSLGIFALPITITNNILNKNNNDFGAGTVHVVVHVYINECKKWIMLDPSFNSYLINDEGNILNLIEIKKAYNNAEYVKIGQYSLNGNNEIFREKYINQFIFLSLFRISIWDGNSDDKRNDNNLLIPIDVDFKEYMLSLLPLCDEIENFCDNLNYISIDEFLASPDMFIL